MTATGTASRGSASPWTGWAGWVESLDAYAEELDRRITSAAPGPLPDPPPPPTGTTGPAVPAALQDRARAVLARLAGLERVMGAHRDTLAAELRALPSRGAARRTASATETGLGSLFDTAG